MSILSAITPFESCRARERLEGSSRLAKRLCNVSQFIRGFRTQLRFGELSRASLRLLRFQLCEDSIECDWIVREPDAWDIDLPSSIEQRHASLQALGDAIEIRHMLFHTVAGAEKAVLRAYRVNSHRERELVIAGHAERGDRAARSIRSIAMRAQLFGFRFSLESGVLTRLPGEQRRRYANDPRV